MRCLPLRHTRRDFGVVLGELAQLAQDVLLGRARGFGDQRRSAEQLASRVASPLHLQDPAYLPVVGYIEGHEHDHPSGQDSAEREKMWAHGTKVPSARAERKQGAIAAAPRLRPREGPMILLP
jgi:hypothetical protein